ncbi:MAG: Ribosomal protein [Verrucomicrobiota bacterium]|jgi:ribosomal protein L29
MSVSFKEMSEAELRKLVETLKVEGLRLRIQKKTGQLSNTATIVRNRRDVARCLVELGRKK